MCDTCLKNNNILIPSPSQAVKGVIALTKSAVGVGLVDSKTKGERMDICIHCDKLNRAIMNQCTLCKCIIFQKTARQEEFCPINKWAK